MAVVWDNGRDLTRQDHALPNHDRPGNATAGWPVKAAARRLSPGPRGRVPRVARLLALAHRCEKLIRDGDGAASEGDRVGGGLGEAEENVGRSYVIS